MASIGRGSRNKGANYERQIAKLLADKFGVIVKRTGAQEKWKVHGGDVNAAKFQNTILTDFFWELKKRESWSIIDWFKKACDDCKGMMQIPVVVASKNNEDDYAFLRLSDFLALLKELDGYRKGE